MTYHPRGQVQLTCEPPTSLFPSQRSQLPPTKQNRQQGNACEQSLVTFQVPKPRVRETPLFCMCCWVPNPEFFMAQWPQRAHIKGSPAMTEMDQPGDRTWAFSRAVGAETHIFHRSVADSRSNPPTKTNCSILLQHLQGNTSKKNHPKTTRMCRALPLRRTPPLQGIRAPKKPLEFARLLSARTFRAKNPPEQIENRLERHPRG